MTATMCHRGKDLALTYAKDSVVNLLCYSQAVAPRRLTLALLIYLRLNPGD